MYKKLLWILAFTLMAVLLLSACERSAVATQSQATATEGTGGQTTLALPDVYKTQTAAGTVTALVLTMQPGAPVGVSTGETPVAPVATSLTPVAPTNTPVPSVINNPAAPTPTPGRPATYTLQTGEFPYCIARRFNVDPDDLLALNGLSQASSQSLQPGLTLTIPQTGSFPGTRALVPHPATYTVQVDDNVYRIACRYGDVDPIYLAAYNGLAAPYSVTSGTVLNIP
jgi:LysM repeat protein